jgi:hypothetical protein
MAVRTRLEELARQIADRLGEDERVVAVLLLGSVAQEQSWQGSDLDLLTVVDGDVPEQAPPLLVTDVEGVPAQVEWASLEAFLGESGREGTRLRNQLAAGARAYAKVLFDRSGQVTEAVERAREFPDATRHAFRLIYVGWAGHAMHAAEQYLALSRPGVALAWARRALDEVGRLALVEAGVYPTKAWQCQLEAERPDLYAEYVRLVALGDGGDACRTILAHTQAEVLNSLPACAAFIRRAFAGCPGPLSLSQLINRLQTACQVEFARALGPAAWGLIEQLVQHRVLARDRRPAEFPTRGNGVVFDEVVYAPLSE